MIRTKSCKQCQAEFSCSADTNNCWCFRYPAVMDPDPSSSCQCPQCLAKSIGKQIHQRIDGLTIDEAIAEAKPFAASPQLLEHIDYTMEDHLMVFTSWHLLKNGKCCGNDCRNCPYPND